MAKKITNEQLSEETKATPAGPPKPERDRRANLQAQP